MSQRCEDDAFRRSWRNQVTLPVLEWIDMRSTILFMRPKTPGRLAKNGSGTLLRIADRYLVATAAHVVRDPNGRYLDVRLLHIDGARAPEVLNRDCHPEHDLAWLEILPQSVAEGALGRVFVTLDCVLPFSQPEGSPVIVFGYPCEEIVWVDGSERDGVEGVKSGYGICTVTCPIDPDFSPDHDVLMPFAREVRHGASQLDENWLKTPPHPDGMSGGGIWHLCVKPVAGNILELRPRLIAIQRGWQTTPGRLSGTPVARWLEMVAEAFPDLREHIGRALDQKG